MLLTIPSMRSCHLVSTEIGEWIMYIPRALRFDLILVQFAILYLYLGLLYACFTLQSTTPMWWSDIPGRVSQD